MKIWDQIQKYNDGYWINESIHHNYSDEILEKYSYIEQISKKYFADQKGIVLLINKELSGSSSQDAEWKMSGWDKSKKSRLNKIVNKLFSLLDDLNDAEI